MITIKEHAHSRVGLMRRFRVMMNYSYEVCKEVYCGGVDCNECPVKAMQEKIEQTARDLDLEVE